MCISQKFSDLYGPSQVDSSFNCHIVGGLQEGPLQKKSDEEQHGQHVCILQEFFGGNKIDAEQFHLESQTSRVGENKYVLTDLSQSQTISKNHEEFSLNLNLRQQFH